MTVDHDAVRDGWEALVGAPGRVPEPFTPEYLLSLMTRAPRAFWRFDVDFSLDAAVRAAELAQIGGVSATFYVMATGSFYNPFSIPGTAAIERIAAHGHTVGMHVDQRAGGMPASAVVYAAGLFAHMVPVVDLTRVSFHMPGPSVLWNDYDGLTFENAYASRWRDHYVSDSRREWDEAKTARLIANGGEGMQVCLHAEHWFGA